MVYCARNPKDVITSNWHVKDILRTYVGETFDPSLISFSIQLDFMMSPLCDGGHLLKHVREFWNNPQELNICYMFYEDSKVNHEATIRKMSKFTGYDLTDDQVNAILENTRIGHMRNIYAAITSENFDQSKSKFIRKGEIGDWKNRFTVRQSEEFDQFMKEELKDSKTPVPFRFE